MGLLDFFFGGKKVNNAQRMNSQRSPRDVVAFRDKFVAIPSVNFFGEYKISHSKEWAICWSDSSEQYQRGGHRDSGLGRYVLYNVTKNRVELQGNLERPNSGSVADNGNFSIEDWHFGSDLSGTFYVISSAGRELIKKKIRGKPIQQRFIG